MPDKAATDERAQQIHDYWFGPAHDWLQVLANNSRRWFEKGRELDAEIRAQFSDTLALARRGELDDWQDSLVGTVALVLLLDQFPRHIFRGTAEAFACDGQALRACLGGLERGLDTSMSPVQQGFYYLPLQHCEDIAIQDRSVELMELRTSQAAPEFKDYMTTTLEFARRHREIVLRFGRYPHRNESLGRVSTREELDFLAAGADRFGQ